MTSTSRWLWGSWLGSRLLVLVLLLVPAEQAVLADVRTFRGWAFDLWHHGLLPGTEGRWEYPIGALAALLPATGGREEHVAFFTVFVSVMLAVDAVLLLVLQRAGLRAAWAWTLLLPLLGPLVYTRFDLLPTLLVVLALRTRPHRPTTAGALLALGALVKVWPLVLLPVLALSRRGRRGLLLGVVLPLGLVLLALAAAGRVGYALSPLTNQGDRGVQMEAVPGVGHLLAHALGGGAGVRYSHGAWELTGSGLGLLAAITTVLGAVVLGGLLLRAWRSRDAAPADAAVLSAAVLSVLLLTDKVLSPQYLVWLLGLVCLVLVGTPLPHRVLAALGGALVTTHLVYPLLYDQLLSGDLLPALLLTVRDGLLVLVTITLIRLLRRPAPAPIAVGSAAPAAVA